LLAIFLTLLALAAFGTQSFAQYIELCSDDCVEHQSSDGKSENGKCSLACCHGVAAIATTVMTAMMPLVPLSAVSEKVVAMIEADPASIDHPPQLV